MNGVFARSALASLALTMAALAASAATAAPSVSWTPKAMDAALRNPRVSLFGELSGNFRTILVYRRGVNVTRAACRGLGSRGLTRGYAAFSCHLRYEFKLLSPPGPFSGFYWTVPWTARSICVTDVSRGTCPPPLRRRPLTGDPRRCVPRHGPVCIEEIASLAARKGRAVGSEQCLAGSKWTVYHCTGTGGGATVTFKQGKKRWSTIVRVL